MAFSFELALTTLTNMGFDTIILPFILIFTIIYAILQKIQIFGNNKNFNVMVALVLGLIPIFYHFSSSQNSKWDVINILTTLGVISKFSTWLIIIVMLLILMGTFGVSYKGSPFFNTIIVGASVLIIAVIFLGAVSPFGNTFGYLDDGTKSALIIILIFGLIVWFVTKDENKPKNNWLGDIIEKVGEGFEKK